MGKILVILLSFGLLSSAKAFALADFDTLLSPPQSLTFEQLFCSQNEIKNPYKQFEISSVCWLRSTQNFDDLEYLEALQVVLSNGEVMIYHLSEFIFDTQISRSSGSQVLKATLRGEQASGLFSVSQVFKEYLISSRLTREDRPLRIFGTLPSGHKFLIKRNLP